MTKFQKSPFRQNKLSEKIAFKFFLTTDNGKLITDNKNRKNNMKKMKKYLKKSLNLTE